MDHECLKNSGLLEQYALGLTNRKETLAVEEVLENSPEARADLEKIKKDFNNYVADQGFAGPTEDRPRRTLEEFEDLDHEMIMDMMDRNHMLNIWRFALGVVILLLIALSGFLFRSNQLMNAKLTNEKALHAQDEHANELRLKNLNEQLPTDTDWSAMRTESAPATEGQVLLHFLEAKNMLFLDLSHVAPLSEDHAYYVFLESLDDGHGPALVITAEQQLELHPISLPLKPDKLRIFRWHVAHPKTDPEPGEDMIADLSVKR
jgi:hypothetical protein